MTSSSSIRPAAESALVYATGAWLTLRPRCLSEPVGNDRFGPATMRITFANEATARAAVQILEQYGYEATTEGAALETDCPALLAVPVVGRTIGLDQVEKVQVADVRLQETGRAYA